MNNFSGVSIHLKDALSNIRILQQTIMDRQRFGGFSGPARGASGSAALVVALVMSMSWYPDTAKAHLFGWSALLAFSSAINGVALLHWFFNDRYVQRDIRRLRPILDAFPPLVVGGAMTAMMILHKQPEYLFGIWMCMFGLTNLSLRQVLPPDYIWVGLFYTAAGVYWLLMPHALFLNPWPMGMIFFLGEWAGGLILYKDHRRYLAFVRYQDVAMVESTNDGENNG